jgi:glutaredoxin
VEYIDLFLNDEIHFPEIRSLLSQGAITTPVVLINGIPKIHGGIPRMIIKEEVEKLLSSGPLH